MRILFCGGCFPASHLLLKERLTFNDDEIEVSDRLNLRQALAKADVVIPMMTILDETLMEGGDFRLVQQWGSGLEGVDLDAARARGIWVANVPASGNNADSVAEHALLLTLALLRQLPAAQANLRVGILGAPLGRMLAGCTVCLYGLGATARALAHRLRPMGVRLIGITRDPAAPKAAEFALDECFSSSERQKALSQTDVLVLCVRLAHQTRGLVDAATFAALPAGALLVNAARGGLIDYRALHEALASGHLGGAGLDVYWTEPFPPDDPILKFPNVIATPHVAGVTDGSYADIADAVASNIERLRRSEPPLNRAA
ncbi:MAG TPA: 2-hydroxyacid dehydrogenase [Candidatus Acidoferrales bacterium]|nr:2-hydroxyacid dehydrogenase [Candidatus Acidoferrales bacterium]